MRIRARLARLLWVPAAAPVLALGAWHATPATASPPPIDASFSPCDASATGSCTVDPTEVEVTFQTGTQVAAVQLSWAPVSSRPAGAPTPDQSSIYLYVAQSQPQPCVVNEPVPSGETQACWPWPTQLDYTDVSGTKWVLNGSYQVAPCSEADPYNGCSASPDYSPSNVGVSAAPRSPQAVHSAVSGTTVRVSWSPAANPEPDLVGYAIQRSGKTLATCSVDGAGTPCNASSTSYSAYDKPPAGTWTYSVATLRFGADGGASDAVASSPTSGSPSTVSPPPRTTSPSSRSSGSGTGTAGSGTAGGATGLAPLGGGSPGAGTGSLASGLPSVSGTAVSPEAVGAAVGKAPSNLSYSDDPVVAPSAKLSTGAGIPVTIIGKADVVPMGMLAVGLIALALAAHVFYLRAALNLQQLKSKLRR